MILFCQGISILGLMVIVTVIKLSCLNGVSDSKLPI